MLLRIFFAVCFFKRRIPSYGSSNRDEESPHLLRLSGAITAVLGGCNSRDSGRTPKKAAKELSKDLKSSGHDAKEGFQEPNRRMWSGRK